MRDPIGIEGGFNVYAYCKNSPLITIDPFGTEGLPSLAVGATIANIVFSMNVGMALFVYQQVRNSGVLTTGNPVLDDAMDLAVYTVGGGVAVAPWLGGPRFIVYCGEVIFTGLTGFGN